MGAVLVRLQHANDRKLIPLYVMDSILKNVKPRSVYSAIVVQVLFHTTSSVLDNHDTEVWSVRALHASCRA